MVRRLGNLKSKCAAMHGKNPLLNRSRLGFREGVRKPQGAAVFLRIVMVQVEDEAVRESKSWRQGADVVVQSNFLASRHAVGRQIHEPLKFRRKKLAHVPSDVRQERVAGQEIESRAKFARVQVHARQRPQSGNGLGVPVRFLVEPSKQRGGKIFVNEILNREVTKRASFHDGAIEVHAVRCQHG